MNPLSSSVMSRRLAVGVSCLASSALTQANAQSFIQAPSVARAGHIVLLGDSVFDNAGYLGGGSPEIAVQLRERMQAGWQITLSARGGATAADVPVQLGRLPRGATHLIISVGGNDAGRQENTLSEPARSVAEGVARIAAIRERFEHDYAVMLDAVLARRRPAAVCTIYDPRFPDPGRKRIAITALSVFNDVICREAFARRLPIIDLRLVCGSDADFASPTGPSVRGGEKITTAIAQLVTEHDFGSRSTVYGGSTG